MKFFRSFSLAILGIFIVAAGCTQTEQSDSDAVNNEMQTSDNMMNDSDSAAYTMAVAVLYPTEGNNAEGTITFEETSQGLQVNADVSGLPGDKHGFHVHLYGDCRAADGTSAGTHFNFEGSSENPPADIDRITGNLGNLTAGSNGEATADTLISNATLNGAKSILGRAVIVHEKANDPSQPPIGAAGSRLTCGVIGIANPDQ